MTNLPNPAPLPCPSWCTTDHAKQDAWLARDASRILARTGETPEWMARWHTCTVATIHNPEAASRPVRISLFRDDSLVDPDANRVVVSAEHADSMHPDTAVKVAAAILAAVEVATGHPGEPLCSVCDTSIEHIPTHPDGRRGGWVHTTDHGQEPHTAHPGGGEPR